MVPPLPDYVSLNLRIRLSRLLQSVIMQGQSRPPLMSRQDDLKDEA
jgi:hypothetical protein